MKVTMTFAKLPTHCSNSALPTCAALPNRGERRLSRSCSARRTSSRCCTDDFGLPTQWPLLDISLFQDPNPDMRAAWKPMLTSGWVGPDDSFVISAAAGTVSQATEALAAYYQLFPDFMGPAACLRKAARRRWGRCPPASAFLAATASLLAFGGVVLRAVALAWQSPEFLFDLTRDPDADKAPVLSQWLGYNNPFNFKILFTTNSAFTWDAAKGEWNLEGANGSLIKNGIRLNYPTAPVEVELRPIALTSYNNTGPAYPFTC